MNGSKQTSLNRVSHGIAWALVFAALLPLFFILIDFRLSAIRGGDNINYILLAKAIAGGYGYADAHIPGSPAHTQYPPLLPFVLSPVHEYFGFNFVWMRLIIIAFGLAAVYMAKLAFEKEDRRAGILIAALVGTNFYFLFFAREIMTEIPYAFLSLMAVYTFDKVSPGRSPGRPLLLALMVAAAYLTRNIGITLYGAVLAAAFLRRRGNGPTEGFKKTVIFAAAAALPFILWMVRGSLLSAENASTYQSIFLQADYYSEEGGSAGAGTLLHRLWQNMLIYAEAAPRSLFLFPEIRRLVPGLAVKALEALILLLALGGFLRELLRCMGVREFYILFYFAIISVWPVYGTGDAIRYMVPVIPFLYYYVFAGTRGLKALAGKRGLSGPEPRCYRYMIVPSVLFLAMNVFEIRDAVWPAEMAKRGYAAAGILAGNAAKRIDGVTPESMAADYFSRNVPCYGQYISAAFELKDISGPQDVAMARKPELIALVTGGYAVRFPFTEKKEEVLRFIEEKGVSYVVMDACWAEGARYIKPAVDENPGRFERVFDDSKGTALYRYRRRG